MVECTGLENRNPGNWIVGSNPTGVTKLYRGTSSSGLGCDPVKVEIAGSNPVVPAKFGMLVCRFIAANCRFTAMSIVRHASKGIRKQFLMPFAL